MAPQLLGTVPDAGLTLCAAQKVDESTGFTGRGHTIFSCGLQEVGA
jgi:hypothetical protein